jgi:hypothetical protein
MVLLVAQVEALTRQVEEVAHEMRREMSELRAQQQQLQREHQLQHDSTGPAKLTHLAPLLAPSSADRLSGEYEDRIQMPQLNAVEVLWQCEAQRPAEAVGPPEAWSDAELRGEGKDTALEESHEDQDQYEFEGSVWDTTLMVGLPHVGGAASMFLIVLLSMNVLIQGFFISIIINNLSSPVITDSTVEEYRKWRTTVGHNIDNYDERQQMGLVARVCKGDSSLDTSASQSAAYSMLRAYVGNNWGTLLEAPGVQMCTLAVTVWVLTISKEFSAVAKVARALLSIPRGDETLLAEDEGEDGGIRFDRISPARLCSCLVVMVGLRVVVSVLLCVYGCLFLSVNTIAIGDLLLNTVALEFIVSVDELIFEAAAPVRAARLIADLRPISLAPMREWKGLDTGAFATFLISIGTVAVVFVMLINPQVDVMVKARDALCSGDTDFVYTIDGLGVMAWSYPSTTDTNEFSSGRNFKDGKDPSVREGKSADEANAFEGPPDVVHAASDGGSSRAGWPASPREPLFQ